MRFGCCLPGGSFMGQGVREVPDGALGVLVNGYLEAMDAGYDFAECGVGMLTALDDASLDSAAKLYAGGKFRIEACNSFVPGNLHVAGDDVDFARLENHADNVMRRMNAVGATILVFGSGAARRCPDGFDFNRALEQNRDFLKMCGDTASKYGVTIAIEPLNRGETNIFVNHAQGLDMVKKVGSNEVPTNNVRLLSDAYHMAREDEDMSCLDDAIEALIHVHVAEPPDRKVPGADGGEYLTQYAKKLMSLGYDGGVSVECGYKDFSADCRDALAFLKKIFVK